MKEDSQRRVRCALAGAVITIAILSGATLAGADEVKVKGDVIHGKITGIKDAAVVVDTGYGKDQILTVPFENIEDVKTDGPMQVLHGEDEEIVGRILGLQNGQLSVGADATSARQIEFATVSEAVPTEGLSWRDRLRSTFRYWDGTLDLGFGLTQSRIDDTSIFTAFSTVRDKAPTRFFLDIYGIYGKQKTEKNVVSPDGSSIQTETEESRIQDNLKGRLRGEYDLTKRLFVFGSGDAEYDGIQRLSIRGVPKAGLGYKIYETKTSLVQVEAGGAWVYEKFFGGIDNNFFAVAFGSWVDTELWYGSKFTWRMDYLPAVDNWIGDYLLRNELALSIPIFDPFMFKISLIDIYDSTPAEEEFELVNPVRTETVNAADHNKLILAIGLSVAF